MRMHVASGWVKFVLQSVGNKTYLCISVVWRMCNIVFGCVYHLVVLNIVVKVTQELFTDSCNDIFGFDRCKGFGLMFS
jgi:hypothetical protein